VGLQDNNTQFLLWGSLTDQSDNHVAVTNSGLTYANDVISCPANAYARIAAGALPSSVMCENSAWTVEIKFRCADTSLLSSNYSCLFGNGEVLDVDNRFDLIINDSVIQIGGMNNSFSWTPDTDWHIYRYTHASDNSFATIFDGTTEATGYFSGNPRLEQLFVGRDGGTRYGYPFEIQYIQISDVGGSGGGSVIDAALVTAYTPYRAAFTAPSSYAVSGFAGDYAGYNGTYSVTSATQYKTGMERVYKHATEDYYLVGWYDDDMIGGPVWGFGSSSSLSTWGAVAVMSGTAPASGSWMNYDMYESMTLTLTGTDTTYPEQPLVLSGKKATAYDSTKQRFTLASSATSFSGFAWDDPVIGALHAVAGTVVVGSPIAQYASGPAIPTGFTSDTSIEGYVITASSEGEPAYKAFNMDKTTSENCWWSGTMTVSAETPCWFAIQLPRAVVPSSIYIMNEIASPENFEDAQFQGSNDGTTWTTLVTITGSPDTTGLEQTINVPAANQAPYTHFRMLFTKSHASGVSVQAFTINEVLAE
jgi:hypothetical protein